jgi:NAD(P)H-hydrate epimerase
MPIPVLTVPQMRRWERATWATGRTESDVIRRVGHLVAHRARAMTRAGDSILVLAGKGHNGDDTRQAVVDLSDREISAINVSDPKPALRELESQLSPAPALVIDGLFGIGLNRPLSPAWIRFMECINRSCAPVLSVDVPSGLDADRGEHHGAAIRATVTLTLGAPKVGLLSRAAGEFVGRLEVAPDIGLIEPPKVKDLAWALPEDFCGFPPRRPAPAHKGAFGHVVLIAGSLGYHGAAVLMARGAARARPGRVTLVTLPEVYAPIAAQLQSVMVHPWRPGLALPKTCSALAFGPGLAAPDVPDLLREQLVGLWNEADVPVLVDATGLDWLPAKRRTSQACRAITPHPGEAARLLATTTDDLLANRLGALRRLSKRLSDCWVVLKGQHTLIGHARGPVGVNPSGNPGLAQGGSGDVLAGFLAGLLAQPALQDDPERALRYGVWAHGAAADRLDELAGNWTPNELADAIGECPGARS